MPGAVGPALGPALISFQPRPRSISGVACAHASPPEAPPRPPPALPSPDSRPRPCPAHAPPPAVPAPPPARVAVSRPPRAARPELALSTGGRCSLAFWARQRPAGHGVPESARRARICLPRPRAARGRPALPEGGRVRAAPGGARARGLSLLERRGRRTRGLREPCRGRAARVPRRAVFSNSPPASNRAHHHPETPRPDLPR